MPYKDPAKRKLYKQRHYQNNKATYVSRARNYNLRNGKEAWHLYQRNRMLLQRYGIDLEGYAKLLSEQGGTCAICSASTTGVHKRYLDVDHCHATKQVRGLLCGGCNKSLGVLENKEWVRKARKYLRNAKARRRT